MFFAATVLISSSLIYEGLHRSAGGGMQSTLINAAAFFTGSNYNYNHVLSNYLFEM